MEKLVKVSGESKGGRRTRDNNEIEKDELSEVYIDYKGSNVLRVDGSSGGS